MRKILLIICFLLIPFCVNATTNVYVSVGGQSNCATGAPFNSNWIAVGQPIFAADVLAATGWTVNFINGCIGGTGLLQQSATLGHGSSPAWMGNPPTYTEQSPYTTLISNIGSNTIKAVLWLGSESDNSDNASDLQGGLQALATHFQTDLSNANLPIIFDVYGQDTEGYSYSTYPSWSTNQLAEITKIPTISHGYLGGMAYDMLVCNSGIHWCDSTPMAHRMANAFLYVFGYSNYIRGPYITGVIRKDANHVSVSIQQNPTSTGWTAVSNPVGFQIFNGASAVTISNVTLTNPTTITITTSGTINAGAELRYMMDINPANLGATYSNNLINNIPRDNTPLALPLELYDATITEASTHTLAGTISGAVQADITVTLTGTAAASTTTASDGTYSFMGLSAGSYTITLGKTGYTFSPTSLNPIITTANITGENFTASAVVASGPAGVAGSFAGTVQ